VTPAIMAFGNDSLDSTQIKVESNGQSYTIQANNAPLGKVLSQLSRASGRQIVIHGECNAPVNVLLTAANFESAVKSLLKGSTYSYVQSDGVVVVAEQNVDTLLYTNLITDRLLRLYHSDSLRMFSSTPDAIADIAVPITNKDLITDKLVLLKHAKADEVFAVLAVPNSKSFVTIDKERNGLLINGTQEDIDRIAFSIAQIDSPRAQINIDVLLVEYSEDVNSDMGLEFGSKRAYQSGLEFPGSELTLTGGDAKRAIFGALNLDKLEYLGDNFYARLKLLMDEGKANVLAKPSISVVNGHEASVDVGQTQYYKVIGGTAESPTYRFNPINFGISLKILPVITENKTINATIEPEISNAMGINEEGYPNVFTRKIKTNVQISDGKTLVLGGLVRQEEQVHHNKVPLLGDIPILGMLFRSNAKRFVRTNLVIYITPHIVSDSANVSTEGIEKEFKSNKYQRFFRDAIGK
jgi:type II secretory pathway component GspD/PulD (secretin)